jgi:hypothetical protein
LKEVAFKFIQSKLSSSNIIEELFSSFAARWALNGPTHAPLFFYTQTSFSHQPIMKMEIEVLFQHLTKEDPKLLMDYIQSVTRGEATFFPTTLSWVYDRQMGREFPQGGTRSGPDSEKDPRPCGQNDDWGYGQNVDLAGGQGEDWGGNQNADTLDPLQASSSSSTPAPTFAATPTTPATTFADQQWLTCARCRKKAKLEQLLDGLHCPRCTEDGKNGLGVMGRPYMRCSKCTALRTRRKKVKCKTACGAVFL